MRWHFLYGSTSFDSRSVSMIARCLIGQYPAWRKSSRMQSPCESDKQQANSICSFSAMQFSQQKSQICNRRTGACELIRGTFHYGHPLSSTVVQPVRYGFDSVFEVVLRPPRVILFWVRSTPFRKIFEFRVWNLFVQHQEFAVLCSQEFSQSTDRSGRSSIYPIHELGLQISASHRVADQ